MPPAAGNLAVCSGRGHSLPVAEHRRSGH